MGKRQHQKDKMYLTYTEWTELYGGKKVESMENEHIKFKRLPFDHCTITMVPFDIPYCDLDGNCFELKAIINFLKAFHQINPITGKHLDSKTLVKMKLYKNNDDEYHCPALFKPFTKNSHIVLVAPTGNCFSWEAVEQLNIKTKNWKDLIDDTPFQRKDIIVIQDPKKIEKFDISKFYHIKKKLRVLTEEEILEKNDPKNKLKSMNMETKETLDELKRDYHEPAEKLEEKKSIADKFNSAHYSTGAVAASFTSTAMIPVSNHEAAIIDEDLVKYERVKKKGYIRITTNFGPLNFEIFCDTVPKASENFIKHCTNGYYDNTKFHRSIKNFMIQGGDPTATGSGGKSIWNKQFEDEFRPNLSHTGRGILSMANSGPNTNSSQFFITYRSCKYLDGKHTIFGKLVGGMDTLNDIEKIEVDNKDCPIANIVIQKAQVFVDPFQDAEEQLAAEREEEIKKKIRETEEINKKKRQAQPLKVFREGVGKYLNINELKQVTKKENNNSQSTNNVIVKKRKQSKGFGDFNSW